MKKQNLLKLALLSIAMMVFTGTWAQVSDGNYVDATGVVTMHTQGKTVGLYAEPDAAYNPDYVGPAWTLSGKARWTWTYPGGLTGTSASGAAVNTNYVEFDGTAVVGNYDINVVESNTDIPCADAGIDHTLVILPQPTMAVTATGSAWGAVCGDILGHVVNFNLQSGLLASDFILAQWRLLEYEVTIDGGTGDPVIGGAPVATTVYTWNKFLASPQEIPAASGFNWTMTAGAGVFNADGVGAPLLNDYTLSLTRDYTNAGGEIAYLYRWEIATASGDGINDRISRKSDYIDGGTSVYGTDGTIDIYVVDSPTTGPIYHIPNAFGN